MKKIGDIEHQKSGVAIPFYLDKMQFVCDCHGEHMTAPDAKTLQTMVQDKQHLTPTKSVLY